MELKVLFADRKLGAASKLAFLVLWEYAGRQPGEIVITADWLGSACGRTPKAARLWLAELEKHDLIKILERNERRGTLRLAIYNPCPGNREATPDCQARLPFEPPEVAGEEAPQPRGSEVLERGPPRPPEKAAELGASPMEFSKSREKHAEFVATPPKPPRDAPSLVPKKKEDLSYQSTKVPKQEPKNPTYPTYPKDSRSLEDAAAEAGVTTIAALLPAAGAPALEEPSDDKERLKARILRACRSTAAAPLAEWVAGAAANLVVYHGVAYEDLAGILADVEAMRRAGSLRDPAAFFHSKCRRLAARLGAPWPRSTGREI